MAVGFVLSRMLEPQLCSSRVTSPFREESGDEELSVLPRHTKVIVTGNNRTKSVLVGLQGVVKKAVGLGGWHWLVLKNGIEVKLQRNALSVLEPPTGNEEDDELDNSSSSSEVVAEKDNEFASSVVDINKLTKPRVRHAACRTTWAPSGPLPSNSNSNSNSKSNNLNFNKEFLSSIHTPRAVSSSQQHCCPFPFNFVCCCWSPFIHYLTFFPLVEDLHVTLTILCCQELLFEAIVRGLFKLHFAYHGYQVSWFVLVFFLILFVYECTDIRLCVDDTDQRVNMAKLGSNSLWRYWRRFHLGKQNSCSSKEQMVGIVERHFAAQQVDEVQVIMDFIHRAKRLKKMELNRETE
ncbi:hypothetical protein V2J09_022474 [Rumex salicifolius]